MFSKTLTLMISTLALFACASAFGSTTHANTNSVIRSAWMAYSNSPYNPDLGVEWHHVHGTIVKIGTVPAITRNAQLPAALVCFTYTMSVNGYGDTAKDTCVYHISDPMAGIGTIQWRPVNQIHSIEKIMVREGFVSSR